VIAKLQLESCKKALMCIQYLHFEAL